jgi:hypothetical protein
MLAGVGVGVGLLVALLAFVNLFVKPLQQRDQEILDLNDEVNAKKLQLIKKRREQLELKRLTALSLPANPNPHGRPFDLAWNEYGKYLDGMIRSSGLKSVHVNPIPPVERGPVTARDKKKPAYQPLTYTVEATGDLTSLVAMFERFYQTPLLHQIKSLTIKPAGRDASPRGRQGNAAGGRQPAAPSQRLALKMTVEALLVDGAEKRTFLLPMERRLLALNGLLALRRGPVGLPLVPLAIDQTGLVRPQPLTALSTPGQYGYIARKNVFVEPAPPVREPTREYPNVNINDHVRLTSVVRSNDRWEAFFYDVFHDINTRIRAREQRLLWARQRVIEKAFQNIPIWDSDGEKQSARVLRVTLDEIVFAYDGEYYRIRMGETLADAFNNKPLTERVIRELGLPPEPEKDNARDDD